MTKPEIYKILIKEMSESMFNEEINLLSEVLERMTVDEIKQLIGTLKHLVGLLVRKGTKVKR